MHDMNKYLATATLQPTIKTNINAPAKINFVFRFTAMLFLYKFSNS